MFSAMINHAWAYGDLDPAMQFTALMLRPEDIASCVPPEANNRQVEAARRDEELSLS